MSNAHTDRPPPPQPLLLWPGVLAVVLQWALWLGLPNVVSEPVALIVGLLGGLFGGVAVVVWWAFLSRATRAERWGAVVLMVGALAVTSRVVHESIGTAGMGVMFFAYAIPVLSLAFVAGAAASRGFAVGLRRVSLTTAILAACGGWTLLRSNGMTGDARLDFAWRWEETAEERLLAETRNAPLLRATATSETPRSVPVAIVAEEPLLAPTNDEPDAPAPISAAGETRAVWPGFRGPSRDGIIAGVRIETDWSASPPLELWRRPVGPGVSSFAVGGDLLYTQEQRGDDEIVASYDLRTGAPVWRHSDVTRFWDSHAGAGPRATPTLSGGHLYTFGGTGILNALDAGTGAVMWSRDAASDVEAALPGWGFASSPLVVDDVVIVAVAGRLVGYDRATGTPRWFGPDGGDGYSSPHLATIDGVVQVLLISAVGARSVAPSDGTLLWEHAWPTDTRIVQPAFTEDGDVLVGAATTGLRRIVIAHDAAGWTTEERWTSNRLKPYFSDFVVYHGYAYGFDGSILAGIRLDNGQRAWKGGRYGSGQLLLLPDQDMLLVLSEEGDLALVRATPDGFMEVARFTAIDGKSWNHPVLVGDVLLIRNSEEMAAFRLPPEGE